MPSLLHSPCCCKCLELEKSTAINVLWTLDNRTQKKKMKLELFFKIVKQLCIHMYLPYTSSVTIPE